MTITIAPGSNGTSTATMPLSASGVTAPTGGARFFSPLSIPADQVYYWSAVWQAGEAASARDVADGNVLHFGDADSAIRWLLEPGDD